MSHNRRGFYKKRWVPKGDASSIWVVEGIFPHCFTSMTSTLAAIIGMKGTITKIWGRGRRCSCKDWIFSYIWSISLWRGFRRLKRFKTSPNFSFKNIFLLDEYIIVQNDESPYKWDQNENEIVELVEEKISIRKINSNMSLLLYKLTWCH